MARRNYKELIKDNITIITAHTGCEGTPDNSMEHIMAAIASNAEIIEVDIREADGYYYLSHDLPEDPAKCVKLTECFDIVSKAENMCMNLDLKTEGMMEGILELAAKYDMCSRIVFTGAANTERSTATAKGAEMWYSMWDGDLIPEGVENVKANGSPSINAHYPMLTDEYLKLLEDNDIGFSAWTVNNEEDIVRLLKKRIMNITTRCPVYAMKMRKEIQGQ